MKRVTILVDDIDDADDDGEVRLVGARGPFGSYVAANRIISVEDCVEPLPTEPGSHFWGALGGSDPCWWFVMTDPRSGPTYYQDQYCSDPLPPSEAEKYCLRVVPREEDK